MKHAFLIAAAWLVASSAFAAAVQAPGSAVNAALAEVLAAVELCGEEATLSPSTLRFGILINVPLNLHGCRRRRDAIIMVSFGDLDAAEARMCQERASREAYATAGHPYTVETKLQHTPDKE